MSPTSQLPDPKLPHPTDSPHAPVATDHKPLKQVATLRPLPAQSSYAQSCPETEQDESLAGGAAGHDSPAAPPLPPPPPPPTLPEVLLLVPAVLALSSPVVLSPIPAPPFPVPPDPVALLFVAVLATLLPFVAVLATLLPLVGVPLPAAVLVAKLVLASADPAEAPVVLESSEPQPLVQAISVTAATLDQRDAEHRSNTMGGSSTLHANRRMGPTPELPWNW
jgi:hypothetical protein